MELEDSIEKSGQENILHKSSWLRGIGEVNQERHTSTRVLREKVQFNESFHLQTQSFGLSDCLF